MRVLVVEDEPDLRAQLVRALEDAGYAVDQAADGEEGQPPVALQHVEDRPIGAIQGNADIGSHQPFHLLFGRLRAAAPSISSSPEGWATTTI